MSKELDKIIADCKVRLDKLNANIEKGQDVGFNSELWWATYRRLCSAMTAKRELANMRYSSTGQLNNLEWTQ